MTTVQSELAKVFRSYGHLCASHPWEVIVATFTLTGCILSMGFLVPQSQPVCPTLHCDASGDGENSSDVILLSVTHTLAVLYIYLQLRNLSRLGSSYLLGIAVVFTLLASFIFAAGVIGLLGKSVTGLNEALPFFLLLVDLNKARTLGVFVLGSSSPLDVKERIGKGMAMLGPVLAIDTMVELLVTGIGLMTGVHQVETICCFGCMSILANFIVFMTFFPASLALVLEMSPDSKIKSLKGYLKESWSESDDKKPNPVTQNIKLIMSVGLVAVHVHSWMVNKSSPEVDDVNLPTQPSDYGLWSEFLGIGPEKYVAVTLGLLLSLKYIFWDTMDIPADPSFIIPKKRRVSISTQSIPKPHTYTPPASPLDQQLEPSLPEKVSQSDGGNDGVKDGGNDERSQVTSKMANGTARDFVMSSCVEYGLQPLLPTISEKCEIYSKTKFIVESSDDEQDEEEEEDVFVAIPEEPRSLQECLEIYGTEGGVKRLSDLEVVELVKAKHMSVYNLEKDLGDPSRAVVVRRIIVASQLKDSQAMDNIPHANYNYDLVIGACCENVVGYIPIPVGVVGPLLLDGQQYTVPMATTEGTLVASTNRGCSALRRAGGVSSVLLSDGMTRGPVVRFPSASMASKVKEWLEQPDNFAKVQKDFNQESRFTRLSSLKTVVAGRHLFIRFKAFTGDAMGMNMVSKGAESALRSLQEIFPDMEIISVSGNFCTDKKPSAVNWIEGRGKSVVCEAVIPSAIVKQTLKTSVQALVDVNTSKNLIGSAVSGSIGGFNAHAANIVTAIYLATGQDPAQNVCSSNCMTLMEPWGPNKEDVYVSCTMPSVEIGTVGGGTNLPGQSSCLQMLGVKGPNRENPGKNAATLARIVCGTVLAGELSLLSALAEGHLVRSHMKHNRSSVALMTNLSHVER
ncbi:3-hydroxy-3-methylglutaryl-coenzyme A reductase-like isoform X2 [Corticium candelabrum]|uniref:3-hydroxy-3-methylglutaryl-coenzyme A reductase-like isoform X2 n=1 Tax=Corticium candelabrum TaxID=121492 RepID=UPI002E271814|nr:3-hydroxy-3-methylglutaryl-coenzyme A reductase-like isoform X2 [Corticium candelabrum]